MGEDYPHFSVETSGEATIHTDQVVVDAAKNTTIVATDTGDLPAPTMSITYSLSDVDAAQALQQSLIGSDLGTYNNLMNSCLTHVRDVLRAGGLDLPTWGLKLVKWARTTFQF